MRLPLAFAITSALAACAPEPEPLTAASDALEAGDLDGALAIYERMLERGDALRVADRIEATLGSIRILARSGRVRESFDRARWAASALGGPEVVDERLVESVLRAGHDAVLVGAATTDEFADLSAALAASAASAPASAPASVRRRIEALAIEFERLQRRGSALDDGFVRLMSRGHCDYPTCSGTLVIELTELGRRELRDRLARALGEAVRFAPAGEAAIEDVIEAHHFDLFDSDVLERFAEGCRARAGGVPDSTLVRSSIEDVRRAVFGE